MSLAVMAAPTPTKWAYRLLDPSQGHGLYLKDKTGAYTNDKPKWEFITEFPGDRPFFGRVRSGYFVVDFDKESNGKTPRELATQFTDVLTNEGYLPVLVTSGGAGDRCHIWAVVPTHEERLRLRDLAAEVLTKDGCDCIRGVWAKTCMRAIRSLHRDGTRGDFVNVTEAEAWQRLELPADVEPQPEKPKEQHEAKQSSESGNKEKKAKPTQPAGFLGFFSDLYQQTEIPDRSHHTRNLAVLAFAEGITKDAFVDLIQAHPVLALKYDRPDGRDLIRDEYHKAEKKGMSSHQLLSVWSQKCRDDKSLPRRLQGIIRVIGGFALAGNTSTVFLSQIEVAKKCAVTQPTISRWLDRLVQAGWLEECDYTKKERSAGTPNREGQFHQPAKRYRLILKLSVYGQREREKKCESCTYAKSFKKDQLAFDEARRAWAEACFGRAQEAEYLALLQVCGPMTTKQIAEVFGVTPQAVSKKMNSLSREGEGVVMKARHEGRGAWALNPECSGHELAKWRGKVGKVDDLRRRLDMQRAAYYAWSPPISEPVEEEELEITEEDRLEAFLFAFPEARDGGTPNCHDQEATRPTPIREHLRRSQGNDDQRRRTPAPAYAGGYVA